jgi:hypothetical protein
MLAVMKDKVEDIDHNTITTGTAERLALLLSKGWLRFRNGPPPRKTPGLRRMAVR